MFTDQKNATIGRGYSSRRVATALPASALMLALMAAPGVQAKEKAPSFSKSDVFFELNDTDGDLGIHARIDGDGWRHLALDDPDGKRILDGKVDGRLALQGLTELFTESAEPSFDELKPEEFFARFPEGTYAISATTIDGKTMKGASKLSHVMPAAPGNIRISGLAAPTDCDEGPVPMAAKPVVISWDPVTKSHAKLGKSGQVKVTKYEMVVEREEPTKLVMSLDLPPTAQSFEVPAPFIAMDSGDGFKFEIVVREASGNQTVFESCFKVRK